MKAGAGIADDYANMARAALQLWEVTGDERFIAPARGWTKTLETHFWNNTLNGYCYNADDGEQLFIRPRMLFDNPTPSANGTMLTVLTRLAMLTDETDYMSRASTLAVTFGDEANRVMNGSGAFFAGFDFLATGFFAAATVVRRARASAGAGTASAAAQATGLPRNVLV